MKATEIDYPPLGREVCFDWKTPGSEFLGLFPLDYPELECFQSEAFEELIDEFANEAPENCFDALAAFLGDHGYSLWSLDSESDTYRLTLSTASCESDMLAYWAAPDDESSEPCLPVRLSVVGRHQASPLGGGHEHQDRPSVVVDRWEFGHMPPVPSDGQDECLAPPPFDDDAPCTLWDLRNWPPRQIDVPPSLVQPHSPVSHSPHYTRGSERWWLRESRPSPKTRRRLELLRLRSLQPFELDFATELAGSGPYTCDDVAVTGCGSSVFVTRTDRENKQVVRCRIERYTDGRAEPWFEARQAFSCLALSPHSVLLFGESFRAMWLERGQQPRPVDLPGRLAANGSPFAVSPTEFVYFTEVRRPHAHESSVMEHRLRMHRIELRSGRRRSVLMEDLFSEQTLDLCDRRIQFRDCRGRISAQPGHASWWILNYMSNEFGRKDLAWLWDSCSDRVLRIKPSVFPRQEPTFHYLPSSNCYVAVTDDAWVKLADFDTLREVLAPSRLEWTDDGAVG